MKNVLKITATAGATALAIGGLSLAAMTPAVATGTASPTTSDSATKEVGAYVYKKLRPHDEAAWTNSGEQRLLIFNDGTEWIKPSIIMERLPDDVCGPGWAIQQDKLEITEDFDWPLTITYPNQFGDEAILVDHTHENLEFYGEVPDCLTPPATAPPTTPVTTPTTPATSPPLVTVPSATPSPSASPSPTEGPSPKADPSPKATPAPSTTPISSTTPSPSPTLGTTVTGTPSGTTGPSAAPTVDATAELARTGANAPGMLALAGAGVLAAGLGVVALVRNRRRTGSSDA
ncbi:hypothetical protein J2M53_06690 [Arthrobacter sp. zg-ZUI100]|uniref:hypothetical protein n=1 Tax=Arthrobacter jiangjiafuii TaxID=2817475 RepID=UPI001AEEE6FF|nr:hypothetical protein [Arthrobacter jiangjiafuii]MBP3035941.1 hypothetical protein [Arthrobacter jiangjiafuii]